MTFAGRNPGASESLNCCTARDAHGTIRFVTGSEGSGGARRVRGPGLSKTRGGALGKSRAGALVATADTRWRDLLEAADVMSEGSLRLDGTESTWYGSTSLVVALPESNDELRAQLLTLASGDPHLRVRVLRMAHREAASRAPAPLGRTVCEVRAIADPRGLRIDVDVQAPLIGVRVPGPLPGTRTPPHD